MRVFTFRTMLVVCLFSGLLVSAPNGAISPAPHRIICVVPMIGTGTLDDPRRPMLAPIPNQPASTKASKGFLDSPTIMAFHSVVGDDGQFAIVELEARDRAAFQSILRNRSLLQSFDLAKTKLETLVPQLRRYKRNFELRMLQGGSL